MKKLLSLLLVLTTVASFSTPAFANEQVTQAETQSEEEVTFFSESEAADIALLFVLNNIMIIPLAQNK
ncbi:hypothetical protein RZN22_11075 [Bacillaceae bacterium S4-13-58]